MTTPIRQEEWTEQSCLHLIEEFRKRPMLWDPSNFFYHKKRVRPKAWEEIGHAIGVPAKAAKHKMIVMMSSFRREKCKILQSIKLAASSPDPSSFKLYKSTWFAFKKMSFMMDKCKKKRGSNGKVIKLDSEELLAQVEENRQLKETLLQHFIGPACKKGTQSQSEDVDTDFDIMAETPEDATIEFEDDDDQSDISNGIDALTTASLQPATTSIRDDNDDEIKSFTSFIASKMRKYSESTKNDVQQQICEIIFRADGSRKRKSSTSSSDLFRASVNAAEQIKTEIIE